ncbi:hypothetical protein DRP53_08180 [candidate division WOR-3 bacterium]|uniref:Methyltransferase domain-containing protein n=1 Tax=candidate division WOR-3 bacterium TaxID=2052148 RepID=A0A660SFN3_UNCW3|nr:MAG: hypothetical protein DRP53_08180 [candidate division WOR-3 bacterium]
MVNFSVVENLLRLIGLRRGDTVLDFGCGVGNYTLPCARAVGRKGRVYALDKDRNYLEELKRRVDEAGLENILVIEAGSELNIPLADRSIDRALFFDVLHSHYFTSEELRILFLEVARIIRDSGLVSIFPHHMNDEEVGKLVKIVETGGFKLVHCFTGEVFHRDEVVTGKIISFSLSRYV